MLKRLIHADWSISPRKRWYAVATKANGQWQTSAPQQVTDISIFLNGIFSDTKLSSTLVGFDFPIGIPIAHGKMTNISDFRSALPEFGTGKWEHFFDIAERPEDISVERPFYPKSTPKGVSRKHLEDALKLLPTELLRLCEQKTISRRAACSLFWTLGANQVGRAAIAGWREIIRPAIQKGAHLWPFDGSLAVLSGKPGVVIAETYPAEAYGFFDVKFLPSESKRRQGDRIAKGTTILSWGAQRSVAFTAEAKRDTVDGFGSSGNGEDRFDAFAGLLQMIEIADGRRLEMTESHSATQQWEGWILGR